MTQGGINGERSETLLHLAPSEGEQEPGGRKWPVLATVEAVLMSRMK